MDGVELVGGATAVVGVLFLLAGLDLALVFTYVLGVGVAYAAPGPLEALGSELRKIVLKSKPGDGRSPTGWLDKLWRSDRSKKDKLGYGQDAQDNIDSPLFNAVNRDNPHDVEDLLRTISYEDPEYVNSAGASAFLSAVLQERKKVINMLLDHPEHGPQVIEEKYSQGSVYAGENALHLAVAQKNLPLATLLLKKAKRCGEGCVERVLNARANGSFFSPLSSNSPLHYEASMINMCANLDMHYGRSVNHLYFGETPLAFAVSTNQKEMCKIILKYGGKEVYWSTDGLCGNTILHLAVVHNLPDMINFILNTEGDPENPFPDKCKTLLEVRNDQNMTPLILAAELGHAAALDAIVKARSTLFWQYASITAYTFPLQELLEQGGVLEHVVREKHIELVEHPLISSLLVKLWSTGFDTLFQRKLFLWLTYLLLLTVTSVVGLFTSPRYLAVAIPARVLLSAGVAYFAAQKLYVELRELVDARLGYFQGSATELIENVCSLVSCSSALLALATGSRIMYAISLFLGWFYLLFFLLGYRSTGTFVTAIIKLLVDDVLVFSSVMFVLVVAFANFFFHAVEATTTDDFVHHLDQSFQTMLGDYDISNYSNSPRNSLIISAVSLVYALFISVTLINSLIAKMSSEYEHISANGGRYWIVERGRIMRSIASEYGGFEAMINQSKSGGRRSLLRNFWIADSNAGDKPKSSKSSKAKTQQHSSFASLAFEYHVENKLYFESTSTKSATADGV